MLHRQDHATRSIEQIHSPAHAGRHLARNNPVGQIPLLIHLQRAEDAHIHMPAAYNAEGGRAVERRRVRHGRHESTAGVDKLGILLPLRGRRAHPYHSVLRLEHHAHPLGKIVRHQGRQSYAQVHHIAILELARHPPGYRLSHLLFIHRNFLLMVIFRISPFSHPNGQRAYPRSPRMPACSRRASSCTMYDATSSAYVFAPKPAS